MPALHEKGRRTFFWGPLLVAAASAGFVLGAICVYFYLRDPIGMQLQAEAETLPTNAPLDKVVALGRIEPKDGILSLGAPAPDRIRRLLVKEGEKVEKDQPLAILASEKMREIELELAHIQRKQAALRLQAVTANGQAQIRAAKCRREQTEKLEPLEIKALKNKIAFLKAQEENAKKDFERYIAAGDAIAKQNMEKQELALRQAQTERLATQSQLEKLRMSSTLDRQAADAQLEAMQAELKQSQSAISLDLLDAQIKQAEERLKETKIRAPCDGKILRILAREGEFVGTQPILQMANVDSMVVSAEVYEADIEHVKPGAEATVTSDIGRIFYKNNALKGKVAAIAGVVGRAQVTPLDPLAATDKRVIEVKIALELTSEQAQLAVNLIGHQVRVEIFTKPAEESR